jgi:hypothetical protein
MADDMTTVSPPPPPPPPLFAYICIRDNPLILLGGMMSNAAVGALIAAVCIDEVGALTFCLLGLNLRLEKILRGRGEIGMEAGVVVA